MNWMLNWSTIAANVVTAFGIIGFALFYFTHQQSQRQFMFTVMLSCIERFQALYPLIRNDGDDPSRLKKYIDLTNEEFFYFQRNYIPKEVIVEWMDTIVDFFPIYKNEEVLPVNYDGLKLKQIHDENLLHNYPRLKKAFTLSSSTDFNSKISLIKAIAKNLGIRLNAKHFRQAHVLS